MPTVVVTLFAASLLIESVALFVIVFASVVISPPVAANAILPSVIVELVLVPTLSVIVPFFISVDDVPTVSVMLVVAVCVILSAPVLTVPASAVNAMSFGPWDTPVVVAPSPAVLTIDVAFITLLVFVPTLSVMLVLASVVIAPDVLSISTYVLVSTLVFTCPSFISDEDEPTCVVIVPAASVDNVRALVAPLISCVIVAVFVPSVTVVSAEVTVYAVLLYAVSLPATPIVALLFPTATLLVCVPSLWVDLKPSAAVVCNVVVLPPSVIVLSMAPPLIFVLLLSATVEIIEEPSITVVVVPLVDVTEEPSILVLSVAAPVDLNTTSFTNVELSALIVNEVASTLPESMVLVIVLPVSVFAILTEAVSTLFSILVFASVVIVLPSAVCDILVYVLASK